MKCATCGAEADNGPAQPVSEEFEALADAWCTRWTKRAARWKAAAKRLRSRWRTQSDIAEYQTKVGNEKGATGWWLVESFVGTRSAEPMQDWSPWQDTVPVGYTYSPAEALAWTKDGTLPKAEG